MLTKHEFKKQIIAMGIKQYRREIVESDESPGVYVTRGHQLIGYWSERAGGKIYKKSPVTWSTNYRKFNNYPIEKL